jgi:hypothetical protein
MATIPDPSALCSQHVCGGGGGEHGAPGCGANRINTQPLHAELRAEARPHERTPCPGVSILNFVIRTGVT